MILRKRSMVAGQPVLLVSREGDFYELTLEAYDATKRAVAERHGRLLHPGKPWTESFFPKRNVYAVRDPAGNARPWRPEPAGAPQRAKG